MTKTNRGDEMNVKDYQLQAARTLVDRPGFEITDQHIMAVWVTIGLSGEAGEVAELIKKGVFHRHGIDADKLHKEIGDVMWYVASLCTVMGFDLDMILQDNIDKLKARYPNGFNSADSVRRVDITP